MTRYRTAVEYAYEQVKGMILNHTLRPGQRLDQDELSNQLQISKTPLRTALERLAGEGLVHVTPHRSARVAPLSPEELQEVYMLREALEAQATRLAVARITDDELAEVRRLMELSEQVLAQGDFLRYVEVNRDFHIAIYKGAKSPVLYRLITMLWDLSLRYRAAYLKLPGRAEASINEHREIVRLLEAREADLLVAYMTLHNNKTKDSVLALLAADMEEVGATTEGDESDGSQRQEGRGVGRG